jgi:hypothetical protein
VISLKIEGYTTEDHTCSECLQFQVVTGEIPICKKKLMAVISEMHVTYKIDEGTCFEVK